MRLLKFFPIALFAILFAPFAPAADFPDDLKSFMIQHIKLLEKQDVEGVIANLHSKGKNREKSVRDMTTQLKQMPFKYELKAQTYIGSDSEFHYVRYRQRTLFDEKWKKMTGGFGIEMDVLTIFGKEDGKWKIFDTYMFSQDKLIDEKAASGGTAENPTESEPQR
jgi:hypothetical protein